MDFRIFAGMTMRPLSFNREATLSWPVSFSTEIVDIDINRNYDILGINVKLYINDIFAYIAVQLWFGPDGAVGFGDRYFAALC
jgi:hypothetical protein